VSHETAALYCALEEATDYVASEIADKHGRGEIAAKMQAHVIVAIV
jgi:hypothetical protein